MDSDRQLHAEVVSALEAVTPPAPWLASSIGESLRAHPRRAGTRFTNHRLSVAIAGVLVPLLVVTAGGLFAIRSLIHPVSAQPPRGDVARYVAMLTRDKLVLDEAYGGKVSVDDWSTSACVSLANQECPAYLARVEGGWQRMQYDLDRTTPPDQFKAEHERMQANLRAFIAALGLGVAAFNAGDSQTLNRVFNSAMQLQDQILWIEAYVVYESGDPKPARDTATATYQKLVARDYDNLHLPALFSSLFTCTLRDAACTASIANTRSALRAFDADLRASRPPDARLDYIRGTLLGGLTIELANLDQVDAASASGNEKALESTRLSSLHAQWSVSLYTGWILYAH
jgi:hypothetical protein